MLNYNSNYADFRYMQYLDIIVSVVILVQQILDNSFASQLVVKRKGGFRLKIKLISDLLCGVS